MGQILSLPFRLLSTTLTFYRGFFHYGCGAGRHQPYTSAGSFAPLQTTEKDTDSVRQFKQHARIHLYSLACNYYLYHKPHYRKSSYQADLVDNLRNVAVPGTGIPLSWFAWNRWIGVGYLLGVYPAVCGMAAVNAWFFTGSKSIHDEYATRLLAPDDWFSYWRLNCNVVGLHAVLHDTPVDYEMENKWTFLQQGVARGVPVSPFLSAPALVIKHKNEEGGMGIYFYKNAVHGGDWIIQERIQNRYALCCLH